jgi:hypothetical protein
MYCDPCDHLSGATNLTRICDRSIVFASVDHPSAPAFPRVIVGGRAVAADAADMPLRPGRRGRQHDDHLVAALFDGRSALSMTAVMATTSLLALMLYLLFARPARRRLHGEVTMAQSTIPS